MDPVSSAKNGEKIKEDLFLLVPFLTVLRDKVRLQAKVLRTYKQTRIEDFSEIDGKHVCDCTVTSYFHEKSTCARTCKWLEKLPLQVSLVGPQQIIRTALEDDTQSLYGASQNTVAHCSNGL